ncbi:succinate dehydrogenase, cytochrome b556 subunit [Stenoxybacter acetivorans]|uniref:succinate dehydrogenase, cytochrome b556 subunit n=1 Tax=Stenoxybacter acetivorans TaxID=422441 RepID=UPI0005609207|nr:succinate dehydrogenase, cytochrome b556 subunit [Stenoxybacter acetivorans]
MQKRRPKFLDIAKIRLSIPAIVSILHRASGVGLFIFLPLILWLFSGTLSDESAFNTYQTWVHNPLVIIILIGLLWAYLHHAFAGIRFLFLDVHKGLELSTARATSKIVFVSAIVLTVLIAGACLL